MQSGDRLFRIMHYQHKDKHQHQHNLRYGQWWYHCIIIWQYMQSSTSYRPIASTCITSTWAPTCKCITYGPTTLATSSPMTNYSDRYTTAPHPSTTKHYCTTTPHSPLSMPMPNPIYSAPSNNSMAPIPVYLTPPTISRLCGHRHR